MPGIRLKQTAYKTLLVQHKPLISVLAFSLPGHHFSSCVPFEQSNTFPFSNQGPVSWKSMTVKWRQSSQSSRHSTIGTRQTEYHKVLQSSTNVQSHLTSSFADNGNASWYSVCRVPMVEWRLDCEDCRHLSSASMIPVPGLNMNGCWTAQGK